MSWVTGSRRGGVFRRRGRVGRRYRRVLKSGPVVPLVIAAVIFVVLIAVF